MKPEKNLLFGKRLKALIKSRDVTQIALAKLIGVSEGSVLNYTRGNIPTGNILIKLSEYLECSVDWLLFGKEPGRIEVRELEYAYPREKPEGEKITSFSTDHTENIDLKTTEIKKEDKKQFLINRKMLERLPKLERFLNVLNQLSEMERWDLFELVARELANDVVADLKTEKKDPR